VSTERGVWKSCEVAAEREVLYEFGKLRRGFSSLHATYDGHWFSSSDRRCNAQPWRGPAEQMCLSQLDGSGGNRLIQRKEAKGEMVWAGDHCFGGKLYACFSCRVALILWISSFALSFS
jgi:hypothetical protein